ncbi:MAG: NADH-quinone oxidoreductase subunit C, partial [Candidatus Omnitrophica bacterium]|nr:NADH-quinone oxidoreductase subunit C [Candidatus Omnitrophota bacterium]
MDSPEIITGIKNNYASFQALSIVQDHPDEIAIKVEPRLFKDTCFVLHKILPSPVMMLFALDERREGGNFVINAVFVDFKHSRWVMVNTDIPQDNPSFESLAKNMHSASLFERETWEMFGIEPRNHPDLRRLRLHDEVCPSGNYPLRKDFQKIQPGNLSDYKFNRVEGDGIFEVPVGPV